MSAIAKGVETEHQLAQLRAMSCDVGQGYFFSKPLDWESAGAMLTAAPHW